MVRVRNPATKGTPRKTRTLTVMAPIEKPAVVVDRPSQPGNTWR